MADEVPMCCECKSQSPQVKCYCMESPISLCSACSLSHFLSAPDAPHRPFPVENHNDEDTKCEVCKLSTAQSICTCLFPWISYCSDCASVHASESTSHLKHSLEPLHAKDFLDSSASLHSYYERQHFIESLQAAATYNLSRLDDIIAQVATTAKELITAVEGWRDNETRRLRELQTSLADKVKQCCADLEALRYRKTIVPRTRIEQVAKMCSRGNLEEMMKEVNMLKASFDSDRVARQLQNVFSCTEDFHVFDVLDKIYFAISKTNRFLSLDLPYISLTELQLTSDYRFKSQSAWCGLPCGALFLCGGQQTKESGQYYKEAMIIDPAARSLQPVASMAQERCRHGILYYKDFVYVFGGYCDEYLASCERYSLQQSTWAPLPDLRDAKDCVTACAWKDRIYTVGYGSNKIEVFDVSAESMFVLPMTLRPSLLNLLVPSYCALVAIDAGELVVVASTEVMRYNISGQATRSTALPTRIDRQWYSQCPAVAAGNSVFFASLEMELWKLDLPTSELSCVMKAKSN